MIQNLPNMLTGLRILAIPLMVLCYYLPQPISTVGAAVVFIVAAVTDWFDGWVARRMGQTSQFGAFLDPVADKLLVTVALILLMHRMDNVFITLAGMVVIGRELSLDSSETMDTDPETQTSGNTEEKHRMWVNQVQQPMSLKKLRISIQTRK